MTPGQFAPLAAIVALSVAGCATETTTADAAPGDVRQCFYTRDVSNYEAVSDSVVNLRVGVNDIYRAELFVPCQEVRFTEGLAIRHIGGGTSAVCSGLDAELIVPTSTGPRTCALNSIRKLSAAEVAALPRRERP